ncbi:MAG: hypothetical protein KAI59_04425 [Planctomycetes bacterium]|nr:hypothetical protein [Planctomycetota bacterium]MCK5473254.1 hypothetical protein [Planctomycetota bacterium]
MNLHKGFKRLTWVLSLTVGPIVAAVPCVTEDWIRHDVFIEGFSICGVVGFATVWAIYGIVLFVRKGFLDKNTET